MAPRRKAETNAPSPRNLEIYALVCEGKLTGAEIGKQFGVTQQRVCQIRNAVEEWARPQWMGKVDVIKEKQAKLLMHLFQEAMEAWERSKLDAVSKIDEVGGKNGARKSTTTKGQAGDPRFIAEARAALADIRKIWGANAQPDAIEPIVNVGVQVDVSMAEVRQQILSDPGVVDYLRQQGREVQKRIESNGNGKPH